MKKTLLIALILILSSGIAIAQQNGSQEGPRGGKGNMANSHRGNPVDRMTEQLGLDETQAAELTLIFEASQQLQTEERQRSRAMSQELRESTHAQILEVLSPDQQVLFEEQRQEREQMREALEEIRADRGYGGGRGTGDCNG